MMPFVKFASVILDLSIDKPLDYGLIELMAQQARRGRRVEVPVRGRLCTGYIHQIKESSPALRVQPVSRFLDEGRELTDELFELGIWMAEYYCTPLKDVFQLLQPSVVRKEKGHKEQLFVTRSQSREELKTQCEQLRQKAALPSGCDRSDAVGQKRDAAIRTARKEPESRSSVDALVRKGLLGMETVKIDRSPLAQEEFSKPNPRN